MKHKKTTGFADLRSTRILFFILSILICSCSQPKPSGQIELEATHQKREPDTASSIHTLPDFIDTMSTFTNDYLMGKFDPAKHDQFTKIEQAYSDKDQIFMRQEAYEAFKKMHSAALKDGVSIKIISATRNFNYQKGIWEKKWLREKYKGWSDIEKVRDILKYSSMPGTSRHHWGTDVDFNSVELAYFQNSTGKKLYEWLTKHGAEYGFAQTYTSKENGRTGYEEEKWHWSYMPLSSQLLKAYNQQITYAELTGFNGSGAAKESDVFRLYVNGIDASLLK